MLTSICLGSQSRFTQKCFSTKHLERKLICIPKKDKVKMFFSDKNVGDFPLVSHDSMTWSFVAGFDQCM